jgi:hypothetical protein
VTTPQQPRRRRHAAGPQAPYGQPAPGWPPRQPGEQAGYERPPARGQQPEFFTSPLPPPAGYERPPGYGQQPPQPSFMPRQDAPPMPPPGYHQQPQPQPGYGPSVPPGPGRPRRRKHTARNLILSLAGAVIGIIVIVTAVNSASGSGSSAAAASSPAAATSAPAAPAAAAAPSSAAAKAPAAPKVIASFTGSGIENTAKFSAPSDYTVNWSYSCAAFGQSGNFIVSGDGGSDFNGASVNELGNGGHGTTHVYDDAGAHYLGIDSECSWSIQVVG